MLSARFPRQSTRYTNRHADDLSDDAGRVDTSAPLDSGPSATPSSECRSWPSCREEAPTGNSGSDDPPLLSKGSSPCTAWRTYREYKGADSATTSRSSPETSNMAPAPPAANPATTTTGDTAMGMRAPLGDTIRAEKSGRPPG